jgi:hypothetical protein
MSGPDKRAKETSGNGDLRFHYNREERLEGRAEPVRRGGFLFRNRSLAIVLIDLLFVFVVFVLLRVFIFDGNSPETVGPYAVEVSAFAFDGEIYVTVQITRDEPAEPAGGGSSLVEVRFPDGTVVTDVLPAAASEQIDVRHVLGEQDAARLIADGEGSIAVEVSLLGETVRITRAVSGSLDE